MLFRSRSNGCVPPLAALLLLASATLAATIAPSVVIPSAVAAIIVSAIVRPFASGSHGFCCCGGDGQAAMHNMRMIFYHRDWPGYQFLDIPQEFFFFPVTEGEGYTAGSRSAGSAYAVYVSFRYVG